MTWNYKFVDNKDGTTKVLMVDINQSINVSTDVIKMGAVKNLLKKKLDHYVSKIELAQHSLRRIEKDLQKTPYLYPRYMSISEVCIKSYKGIKLKWAVSSWEICCELNKHEPDMYQPYEYGSLRGTITKTPDGKYVFKYEKHKTVFNEKTIEALEEALIAKADPIFNKAPQVSATFENAMQISVTYGVKASTTEKVVPGGSYYINAKPEELQNPKAEPCIILSLANLYWTKYVILLSTGECFIYDDNGSSVEREKGKYYNSRHGIPHSKCRPYKVKKNDVFIAEKVAELYGSQKGQ